MIVVNVHSVNIFYLDETTAPSTVAASGNAIGPERHVMAEGYRLMK